jgi:hypothetical protein
MHNLTSSNMQSKMNPLLFAFPNVQFYKGDLTGCCKRWIVSSPRNKQYLQAKTK